MRGDNPSPVNPSVGEVGLSQYDGLVGCERLPRLRRCLELSLSQDLTKILPDDFYSCMHQMDEPYRNLLEEIGCRGKKPGGRRRLTLGMEQTRRREEYRCDTLSIPYAVGQFQGLTKRIPRPRQIPGAQPQVGEQYQQVGDVVLGADVAHRRKRVFPVMPCCLQVPAFEGDGPKSTLGAGPIPAVAVIGEDLQGGPKQPFRR